MQMCHVVWCHKVTELKARLRHSPDEVFKEQYFLLGEILFVRTFWTFMIFYMYKKKHEKKKKWNEKKEE